MMRKIRQDNKADPEFINRHPLANSMLFNVQLQYMFDETRRQYGDRKAQSYLYDMVVQMQMMVAHGKTFQGFDVGSVDEAFEELFGNIM